MTRREKAPCGCQGYDLPRGSITYCMIQDLGNVRKPESTFRLFTRHGGLGDHLGDFPSFEKADRAARAHAREILKGRHGGLKTVATAIG